MNYPYQTEINNFLQKVNEELFMMNSVIKTGKKLYSLLEATGEYYGINREKILCLSEERNDYVNLLILLSERTENIYNALSELENKNFLQ